MQEIRELLNILKKYRYFLITSVLLGWLVALAWTILTPENYKANSTLYVYRTQESLTDKFYTYEGYYSQQASKEYTDVVIGLLKSPDLARLALEKTKATQTNPDYLLKDLKVKKVAPQLISLTVSKPSAEEARSLLVSLAVATSERTQTLNKEGNRGVIVSLVKEEPLILKPGRGFPLNFTIGSLAGLIVGLSLTFTVSYLKRP